jgi:choline dehydrogenase-like flavoprotein
MPDEEIAEEGVLTPLETTVQDPLLREILSENQVNADTEEEQPQAISTLSEEVDCVVIGLGAGGSPLLARLAQAGLKVVALEAGPWHDPTTDFATDEKAQSFLYWNDERLAAGGTPLAMGRNNSGTGVGGSTLHYTAYTPRPLPDDLTLKTDFGVGEDWPVTYDELAPYYEEVEQFIGVSGPTPYPWGPARSKGYALPPLPLNSAAQLMMRGAEKVGISTSPAANAALSAPFFQEGVGWRQACTNRGFCQAGCSNGAKSSMDVTYIPLAVQAGADIRPDSFVTEIERNDKGLVSAVVYIRNGQTHRIACKHLFLCAGAVETPRLLLLNELALTSGQVGRNLMAHTGIQVWGTFADEVRPTKGIPGGLISQDTHRPKDADFVGGYLLQSIGVMPVTFASQAARGRKLWGQAMRDYMQKFNHIAGINILGDCLPHADNYLELSDELDARQLPKPRIHFTAQENEQRMTAHAEKTMRDIWEAAGATDIWSFDRYAHVIGTARMGLSGDDAVVDRNGRAFDVPNLYISDNSTFPSALSVNPALTIMALSLRTADKFLESLSRIED